MGRRRLDSGNRLSVEDHWEIQRRVTDGETFALAAAAVGCSTKSIQRFMARTGGLFPKARERSPLRLSPGDREELSRGLLAGESFREIAERLGRSPSTISREVSANGCRSSYRAWRAEQSAARRARRPRTEKLAANPRLCRGVARRLLERWSPQHIAARLVRDYPDDQEMRVSHETIYRTLFVQARGALRKELAACLRTGRTQRCSHKRTEDTGTGRLRGMVMISDRPAEAADRAIPGHWEGDLLMGKGGRSAVGTLVERSSRYVLLLHLPHGPTRQVHRRHKRRGLFLRPAQPMAAREQREHQRPPAPVPAANRRLQLPDPKRPHQDCQGDQQPPPPDPQLDEAFRGILSNRCINRLRPPWDLQSEGASLGG